MAYDGDCTITSCEFSKGHGTTPTRCTATIAGYGNKTRDSWWDVQISGSLWSGIVRDCQHRKSEGGGWETVIRAVDMRDYLWSETVFGQVNMIDDLTGEVYSITGSNWASQTPNAVGYIYPRTLIGELLGLITKKRFTAEYSSAALQILRATESDDWRNSRYNVFGLDWNTGAKVGAAIQQVLESLGLQCVPKPRHSTSDQCLRITVIGEQDYPFLEWEGQYAVESETGEAVQEDVDTGVTIVGERDIYEFTDAPLEPAWNQQWNEIALSAAAQQKFWTAVEDLGGHNTTVKVGDDICLEAGGFTDDGFVPGYAKFSDMTVAAYLEAVPFHVYRISGMENFLSEDELNGTTPARVAPIVTPLLSDPSRQYLIYGEHVKQRKNPKKYKDIEFASQSPDVMKNGHVHVEKEHGHRLIEKSGHVVFDTWQVGITEAGKTALDDAEAEFTWQHIKADAPTITVCMIGSVYNRFFGTHDRAGSKKVGGLRRAYIVDSTDLPVAIPTDTPEEFILDGEKTADEIAEDVADSLLSRKRVVKSGSETFFGAAGHEPCGEIRRVTVKVDGKNGISETVDYANDEPTLTYEPQIELARRIAQDAQAKQSEKLREDRHNEYLRKLAMDARAAEKNLTEKDKLVAAVMGAQNAASLHMVKVSEEVAFRSPVVATKNEETGNLEATPILSCEAGDFVHGIAMSTGSEWVQVATEGVVPAKVKGPASKGDSLDIDTTNACLKAGTGGIVLLEDHPEDTVITRYVRIGGAATAPNRYKIVSVGNDVLLCHTWDGTTEGADSIIIAKPYLLRRTPFHGQTRNGVTYSYTNAYTRTASKSGEDNITEIITTSYQAGDIIRAIPGPTDVTYEDEVVMLEDANNDGRDWNESDE